MERNGTAKSWCHSPNTRYAGVISLRKTTLGRLSAVSCKKMWSKQIVPETLSGRWLCMAANVINLAAVTLTLSRRQLMLHIHMHYHYVRMAERSKAPDSRWQTFLDKGLLVSEWRRGFKSHFWQYFYIEPQWKQDPGSFGCYSFGLNVLLCWQKTVFNQSINHYIR